MGIKTISVVVPVYRNRATLRVLFDQIQRSVAEIEVSARVIFVEDGCPDYSADVLQGLPPSTVTVVRLPVNNGQQFAIREGLRHANGEAVIVMDADLQDPPEVIPSLLAPLVATQCEAVFATRRGFYQNLARTFSGRGFRYLMRRLVPQLPAGAGGFVAIAPSLVERLNARKARDFYLAGLIGVRAKGIEGIPVGRNDRAEGKSTYSFVKRWSVAYANIICVLKERRFVAQYTE